MVGEAGESSALRLLLTGDWGGLASGLVARLGVGLFARLPAGEFPRLPFDRPGRLGLFIFGLVALWAKREWPPRFDAAGEVALEPDMGGLLGVDFGG